ncbi:histidine kinase dimerization/phosphoacceptor domain-containing protein [Streptomyces mirabilis]|uniref:histidine kinase dimerization/phosphoacceptor domain-containing protein n=1 Tax=Streptomyces mirabilis TaxID=68239 RepID=UPI00366925D8
MVDPFVAVVLGISVLGEAPGLSPVTAVAALAYAVFTVLTSYPSRVLLAAALIALYTVARTVRRRLALIATAVTAAALYAVMTGSLDSAAHPDPSAVFAWAGMFAAVGGTVRTWHDYLAAVEERAARAEATKEEEEARRRVAEERLRLARELHDVIAHHIALITLQAGAAGHLLRSRPDQAELALSHIHDAGRTGLDELGSLLYVLRQSGDDVQPTEPVPVTRPLTSCGRPPGFPHSDPSPRRRRRTCPCPPP